MKTTVGSAVLDAILCTADGADIKGIDEYQLHKVITVILYGDDRPTTMNVHKNLLEVMTHDFDFRRKTATNLEALHSMVAKMATYDIGIPEAQLVLTVFANIASVMAHEYGREFRSAMAAIRKLFGHQYDHTVSPLKAVMKDFGSADGIRAMKKAPSPSNLFGSNGAANTVDDSIA